MPPLKGLRKMIAAPSRPLSGRAFQNCRAVGNSRQAHKDVLSGFWKGLPDSGRVRQRPTPFRG
jgi:hypothetical protein